MIGNDVVDLADPRTAGKSRDLRFVKRVFTVKERRAIFNHRNGDVILWSLWAAKETAYKAMRKIHSALSSAPRRYEIELFPSAGSMPERGLARTPCGPVFLRLFVRGDHLHCVGVTEGRGMDSAMWDVVKAAQGRSSPAYQSHLAREMIIQRAAGYLRASPGAMKILRAGESHGLGPPELHLRNRKTALDISMSHDGPFVAWALQDMGGEPARRYEVPDRNPAPSLPDHETAGGVDQGRLYRP